MVVRGHAGVWFVSVGCLSSHSVCVGLSEGMPVSGLFLWAASALTAVDRETQMLAHIQTCRKKDLVGHQCKLTALKIDSSFQICPIFIRSLCMLSGKPVNFCLLLLFR